MNVFCRPPWGIAALIATLLSAGSVGGQPVVAGLVDSALDPALKGRVLAEELQCTACHGGWGAANLQVKRAPRLAAVGTRVNPDYLQQFIANPHKIKPGTTMPDVLGEMDPAERQQVARALTHFLVSKSAKPFQLQAPDAVAAKHGEALFHAKGCVLCHSPRNEEGIELLPETSVPLGALEKKYSVKTLADFLRRPHAVRPSGRMPDMGLAGNEPDHLAHYLVQKTRVPGHLAYRIYRGQVWNGLDNDEVVPERAGQVADFGLNRLGNPAHHTAVVWTGWLRVKQAGTHTFFLQANGGALTLGGKKIIDEAPSNRRSPQDFSGAVELPPGLHALSLTYFHTGRKPTYRFEMEAPGFPRGAIPSSLLTVSDQEIPEVKPLNVDRLLVAEGQKHFSDFGCANCHDDMKTPPVVKGPEWAQLNSGKGCLAATPGSHPNYALSSAQRKLLEKALPQIGTLTLTDQEQIDTTLVRFNCIGCHDRTGLGGISPDRKPHFSGTHPELGEQGRLPPPLSHVGAKLTTDWMREVLVNGKRQRHYLDASMPQYGEAQVGHLADLFKRVDRLEEATFPKVGNILESKRAGYEMMGSTGFSCVACHDFNGRGTGGAGALDLVHVTERIEKNWFHLYMRNPSRFHPTVIMPSYWPGGQSIRPNLLEGDTAQQIEALWVYLQDGARAKKPQGLSRQSNEVRVADVAEMVRGRGTAGFRGIGVGYPERINLAFDSEEMALRVLWKGGFASVNNGSFRASGTDKVSLPVGVPFHRLPSLDDEWPFKGKTDHTFPQDLGYRYKGYRLDGKRRPTFSYRFGTIEVTDFFEDIVDDQGAAFFRRTLQFETATAQPEFLFRAAAGPKVVRVSDRVFKVDRLELRLPGDVTATVRDGEPSEVLVPITLPAGKTTLILEYQW